MCIISNFHCSTFYDHELLTLSKDELLQNGCWCISAGSCVLHNAVQCAMTSLKRFLFYCRGGLLLFSRNFQYEAWSTVNSGMDFKYMHHWPNLLKFSANCQQGWHAKQRKDKWEKQSKTHLLIPEKISRTFWRQVFFFFFKRTTLESWMF